MIEGSGKLKGPLTGSNYNERLTLPTELPFTINITSPVDFAEFVEGDDVVVQLSFNRANEALTKVDLLLNDVVILSHVAAPFDADFTVLDIAQGNHTLVAVAYEGEDPVGSSEIVDIVVEQMPLTITILTPSEGAEYTEGDDVIVSYEFNREYPEVDKVEFWINGVKEVELSPPTGAAFGAVAGEMLIETRAVDVANNTLASDTVTVTVAAVFEAETTALMTALAIPNDENPSDYTGLTNAQIWTIVNNRFLGYKANGLLSELQAEYWMLGSTAAQHSYNALNPSAFQITWFGGWVHSELGALANGINSYAKTGFIPSNEQEVFSNGQTIIQGTDFNEIQGDVVQIGCHQSTSQTNLLMIKKDNKISARINGSTISDTLNIIKSGIFTGSRVSETSTRISKNGILITNGNSGGSLPTIEVYIGTGNINGAPHGAGYTIQRIQGGAIHTGLSDAQVAAYHAIVDEFENALGRKTW